MRDADRLSNRFLCCGALKIARNLKNSSFGHLFCTKIYILHQMGNHSCKGKMNENLLWNPYAHLFRACKFVRINWFSEKSKSELLDLVQFCENKSSVHFKTVTNFRMVNGWLSPNATWGNHFKFYVSIVCLTLNLSNGACVHGNNPNELYWNHYVWIISII